MTVWKSDKVVAASDVNMDAGELDKLAKLFSAHAEKRDFFDGAQVAVYRYGKRVLYMGGGLARVKENVPVRENTLFVIFSSTKGMASTAMHMLHERGKFKYSDTVASVWPEFGKKKNKDKITFTHLMGHRGGFPLGPAWLTPSKWGDRKEIARAMEEIELWWEPGAKNGYHAVNYGFMVNELIQRLDGRDCGTFLREEIFTKLGIQNDCFLGLPPSEDHRVAYCFESPETRAGMTLGFNANAVGAGAGAAAAATAKKQAGAGADIGDEIELAAEQATVKMPAMAKEAMDTDALKEMMDPTKPHLFSRPHIWRLVLPFGGGMATADALAHFYAPLAMGGELDGVRVLQRATIENACVPTNKEGEKDQVIQFPLRWGLGYILGNAYGPGATLQTLGHGGMGGQNGFADLPRGLSYGFVNTAGKGAMLPFMMFNQQLQAHAIRACK